MTIFRRRLNGRLQSCTEPTQVGIPPSQVGNLTVGTPGVTSVSATYTPSTGDAPISYSGSTSVDGGATWALNSGTFLSTGGAWIGLMGGAGYKVKITSANAAGSTDTTYSSAITTATSAPLSTAATRFDIVGSASTTAVGAAVTHTLYPNGMWGGQTLTPSVAAGAGTFSPASVVATSGSSAPVSFSYTSSAAGEHYVAVANSGSLHTPYHAPLNVYAASAGAAQTMAASILSGVDQQCHQFDTLQGVAAGFSFAGARGWGEVWINVSAIGGATGGLFVRLYDALSSGASTTVGSNTALHASPVQVYGAVSATGTRRLLLPASAFIYFMDIATDAAFTHPVRIAQRFSVGLVMGVFTRSFECGIARVYAESQSTPIGSFGAPLTTTGKLSGDYRYGGDGGVFYRQDGATGDPADTGGDWVPSTGAMEAGRIVAAQMGVTLAVVGCAATSGGLDEFVNHDGSLTVGGGFENTINGTTGTGPNGSGADAAAPGKKFRWFWGAWNGWDGVDSTNYPTETLAESTTRLQAAPGWILSNYPACAVVGIACASGIFGQNGSSIANGGVGYTRLQSVAQAMEDSNPAVVSKGNYAWNEFDGGHATNGSKRLYADTGVWQLLSAELAAFGGLQTANRGPRLATSTNRVSGSAVINLPYTLHGGTTLQTVNIVQSNPSFTVTTGTATSSNLMSLFTVYPAGGTAGAGSALALSSAAIDTANSRIVLTLAAVPSGGLTVHYAADFGISGGDGETAAGHVCMITDDQTGPAGIPFGRWMIPQLDIAVAEVSASNPTPPALTGIMFTQPAPVPATLNDGIALHFIPAIFAPIGGAGPFVYSLTNASGSYATIDETGRGGNTRGWIADPSYSSQSNALTLSITDGSGTTVTKDVTIDASLGAGPQILVAANRTWPANENPYNLQTQIVLWNSNVVDTATAITITDTTGSGFFSTSGNDISLPLVVNFPPVGSYPLTISAPGYTSVNVTITITAPTAGTPYFVQTLATVSTAVIAGTIIGKIVGTTPNNTFKLSLADSSGTLGISGTNVIIATPPSAAGLIPFTFTITDKGVSTSANCTASGSAVLNVVTGTTLASSAMNFAGLTTTFTNDTFNNTIGTIATPTGITGTPAWTLVSQSNLNPLCANPAAYGLSGFGSSAARYQLDAAAGALTAPAILSAGLAATSASATDTLVISCTDGINTCTANLSITVNWAAVSQTYYVGRGMAAAHGANGFEHLVTLRDQIDNVPHAGTYQVLIYADADPDYYANDTGTLTSDYQARYPWTGPILFTGVAANGVAQPRLGGVAANNVAGGADMSGKGFITVDHGDCIISNIEGSGNHGGSTSSGIPFITKNGMTYGNMSVLGGVFHDNDVHLLSGYIHGQFWLANNEFGNHGTEHSGSGPLHGIYLDGCTGADITENVFRRGTFGHEIKTRGTNIHIYNNRIFDGLSGSASAMVDACDGGVVEIDHNVLVKGPMGLNPNMIQYGEEALAYSRPVSPWLTNTLSVHDNTIDALYMTGAHQGGPNIVAFTHFANANGVQATGTYANNSVWMYPNGTGANVILDDTTTFSPASGAVAVSGTTTRTLPTTIDMTRPYLSGNLPALGGLFYHTLYGQDDYHNFEGVYQFQDRDQINVAHTATAGTTLCTIHAINDLAAQGAGTANPFIAGTTWAIITDAVYYPSNNANPWATAGKYAVVAQSDGSALLEVGSTTLATGVDYVQVRATAPNGTLCDSRYAITVS